MSINLKSISSAKHKSPPRIFLYGTHGIGKSTFAASMPNPVFLQTEDGLSGLDVPSFPLATTSDEIFQAINSLYTEEHDFKTVVLDSADWLENIFVREIEDKYDAKDLAYGKAAVFLADKWREMLAGLNALRNDKGMVVCILGHQNIKRFDSPETEGYDRFEPKLQARSSALVQEWSDVVFFASYKTIIKKEDVGFGKTNNRGISNGERILYTNERPAALAKNRYSMPDTLPMNWESVVATIK